MARLAEMTRLLSEESRRRLERSSAEVVRLYGLPDRWLGRALAVACRELRAAPSFPVDVGNTRYLLWDVGPYLASRLGEPLLPGEATDTTLRGAGGDALRRLVGGTVSWVPSYYRREDPLPPRLDLAADILTRDAANGSLVAMALDRVAPPDTEADDYLARHVREVSRRRGYPSVSAWNPGLQDRTRARRRTG